MWWKIYFWLYLVLSIVGVILLLPQIPTFNFASWEGFVENIILIVGTYSFVYSKNIIISAIWKVIFILISLVWVAQVVYYSNAVSTIKPLLQFLENKPPQSFGLVAISILLSIPAMIAVYKLAFTKK